ncbi:hypothetical protein ACFL6I_13285 [candidate division KSB1 bacterium]
MVKSDDDKAKQIREEKKLIKFLTSTPLMSTTKIFFPKFRTVENSTHYYDFNSPMELRLFCDGDKCKGITTFALAETFSKLEFKLNHIYDQPLFLKYFCKNCPRRIKSDKMYFLLISPNGFKKPALITKVGEYPEYLTEKIPNNTLKFLDDAKPIFLKGKQCENHGLGLGAISYYRRAIENKKDQLIDKLIDLYNEVDDKDTITELKKAKGDKRFTKAIEPLIKLIPETLYIRSDNPLGLLHDLFSTGIHKESDEKCMEIATDTCVIFIRLIERINEFLKEDKDVEESIKRVRKLKQKS